MSNRGKSYKRRLTDDEVREMRRLHTSRGLNGVEIGRMFGVSAVTAGRAIAMRSYTHVDGIDLGTPEFCPCLTHAQARRRSVNLNRARAAVVSAVCLHCQMGVVKAVVGDLLENNGAAVCRSCEEKLS